MMNIPNIKYSGNYSKIVENADYPIDCIYFYKDKEFFDDNTVYEKFVKACEQAVRKSQDYTKFIAYVKNIIGINFCQISSQIFDTDATIEMHHGPIFTLYDYCAIVLNSFIDTGKKITTLRIADQVIQEHYDLRVQIVMLAITNHEALHNRDIFVNIKQGFGNINEFIKKYSKYFDDDQKYKIWNYINICKDTDSYDHGILDTKNIEKLVTL